MKPIDNKTTPCDCEIQPIKSKQNNIKYEKRNNLENMNDRTSQ